MSTTADKPADWTPKINDLISRVVQDHETVLDLASNGNDRTIKFSLQRQLPPEPRAPKRTETQAREHMFYEAASFAAYLSRYGTKGDAVVYADPSTETCWATLAERATGGIETLTLKPQLHPLWAPWAALVAKGRMPLNVFRDFLNQHRRSVITPNGRVLALQLAQIRAAVEITIHDGRGRNALNGIVVKSIVQGVETKDVVDLPEELVLKVPLYVGGDPQEVKLDLVLDAGTNGEVTVMIAAGGVAEARVFAFDKMLGQIVGGTKSLDATVTYGQPASRSWSYLPETRT